MKKFKRLVTILLCIVPTIVFGAELGPGDKGYKHGEYHDDYQRLFDSDRCYCKSGECRPTAFQYNPKSPSGVDLKINGDFYPAPPAARITKAIPPGLAEEPAHVCAYPDPDGNVPYIIECWIINIST